MLGTLVMRNRSPWWVTVDAGASDRRRNDVDVVAVVEEMQVDVDEGTTAG